MSDPIEIDELPVELADEVLVKEFERRERARQVVVPTDDSKVKQKLRELEHPICLFGEGPMERRERLRFVLSELPDVQLIEDQMSEDEGSVSHDLLYIPTEESEQEEEFYTEGTKQLLEARRTIAYYSLPRARARINRQKEMHEVALLTIKNHRAQLNQHLQKTMIYASQTADTRPVSICGFSPNSEMLVTGSWSGLCSLWQVPGCQKTLTLKGHGDRVTGVAFHPEATLSLDPSVANLATGSADKKIHLWALDKELPIATLAGHTMRICRVRYHPSGRYLGSTSFDTTWRLWDMNTTQEILLQEGHSKEVFGLAFQCDGSLVATGGYDGVGKVWDLRTGRSIMDLQGHIKEIYGLDFAPNGYQIATGSGDHTIRIFDLRVMKSLVSIPAHQSLISEVRFFQGTDLVGYPTLNGWLPGSTSDRRDTSAHTNIDTSMDMNVDAGHSGRQRVPLSNTFLTSSSYDGTIKVWSMDDWQLQKTLSDHDGRVMGLDVSNDGQYLASCGFDKTFKLWSAQ
ncbi:WD40-repeat-containing domain protein [Dimargaris cristalligena]|uniref:WD40-repeat-containing domain protein n=1 Tax=Dimargaris cristalligena TaxID=215637 RepID=A0A4P9ZSR6_9FUNG|nr:WD40-repeat-containing domain protein [Dimargaris cristalligena]|eukprot:RKP35530.1 WD40-repeat-containing domain protein [Dimargaris cristalligena]